jgi:hypothetical protein
MERIIETKLSHARIRADHEFKAISNDVTSSIPYPHEADGIECHRIAAEALIKKDGVDDIKACRRRIN